MTFVFYYWSRSYKNKTSPEFKEQVLENNNNKINPYSPFVSNLICIIPFKCQNEENLTINKMPYRISSRSSTVTNWKSSKWKASCWRTWFIISLRSFKLNCFGRLPKNNPFGEIFHLNFIKHQFLFKLVFDTRNIPDPFWSKVL